MGKFLKIKCEGGGGDYAFNDAIEFVLNVSDFVGFVDQFSNNHVILGIGTAFSNSNFGVTSAYLEVEDSTGVDTKPSIIVEKTIMETLLSNPGGDFLNLVLPQNYAIKSYEISGYII